MSVSKAVEISGRTAVSVTEAEWDATYNSPEARKLSGSLSGGRKYTNMYIRYLREFWREITAQADDAQEYLCTVCTECGEGFGKETPVISDISIHDGSIREIKWRRYNHRNKQMYTLWRWIEWCDVSAESMNEPRSRWTKGGLAEEARTAIDVAEVLVQERQEFRPTSTAVEKNNVLWSKVPRGKKRY